MRCRGSLLEGEGGRCRPRAQTAHSSAIEGTPRSMSTQVRPAAATDPPNRLSLGGSASSTAPELCCRHRTSTTVCNFIRRVKSALDTVPWYFEVQLGTYLFSHGITHNMCKVWRLYYLIPFMDSGVYDTNRQTRFVSKSGFRVIQGVRWSEMKSSSCT